MFHPRIEVSTFDGTEIPLWTKTAFLYVELEKDRPALAGRPHGCTSLLIFIIQLTSHVICPALSVGTSYKQPIAHYRMSIRSRRNQQVQPLHYRS